MEELLEAVRDWLEGFGDVPVDPKTRFDARVAANVLAIIARELAFRDAHLHRHRARLTSLGVADDAELATLIRSGRGDDRWEAIADALREDVHDRLAVNHPGYDQSC